MRANALNREINSPKPEFVTPGSSLINSFIEGSDSYYTLREEEGPLKPEFDKK